MPWQAALLRFTIFPAPNTTLSLEQWWQAALDFDPEQVAMDRRLNMAQLQGQYGAGQFRLIAASLPLPRVDWLWAPSDSIDPADISTLGAYKDALGLYRLVLDRALAASVTPVAHRIALGLVLQQPVETRKEGYTILQEYLKNSVRLDSENSSDFIYQINRARILRFGDTLIPINRIAKWSVVYQAASAISLTVTPLQPPLLSDSQLLTEHLSAQLELDINTAPNQTPHFVATTPTRFDLAYTPILAAFQEFALEIAEQGDIP